MSRTKATKATKGAKTRNTKPATAAVRATPTPAHIARPRGDKSDAGNGNAAQGSAGDQGTGKPEWASEPKSGAPFLSPDRKKIGRPRFEPTADQRRQVESLAGLGIPQAGIASMVKNPSTGQPIDEKTLRQCFERELLEGVHKANAAVSQSLYQKAMGNGHQSVAAAIFYLKCRAGWRERLDVAVDIKGGVLVPPASMTPEQWIAAQAAMNAARAEPGKSE